MKLSIIVSILNSHEIVRRQILYFSKLGVSSDVEILYMDDGSDPPLSWVDAELGFPVKNLHIIPVNNPKLWSRADGMFADGRVSVARNLGAKIARGEFLLMTDIDYIITDEAIEAGCNLKYDKAGFKRQFGVLLEDGTITQNLEVLRSFGLMEERIEKRLVFPPHPNNFIMRKSTFWEIGGYRENIADKIYPSGGDRWFKRDWTDLLNKGLATIEPADLRKTLLMFPNGQWCGDVDANPFGLFHTLSRKTERNHWYVKNLPSKMPQSIPN
jgi:hypothetical protein